MCCLDIVRVIVSPRSSHSFRILVARNDVVVIRDLFVAYCAYAKPACGLGPKYEFLIDSVIPGFYYRKVRHALPCPGPNDLLALFGYAFPQDQSLQPAWFHLPLRAHTPRQDEPDFFFVAPLGTLAEEPKTIGVLRVVHIH